MKVLKREKMKSCAHRRGRVSQRGAREREREREREK